VQIPRLFKVSNRPLDGTARQRQVSRDAVKPRPSHTVVLPVMQVDVDELGALEQALVVVNTREICYAFTSLLGFGLSFCVRFGSVGCGTTTSGNFLRIAASTCALST